MSISGTAWHGTEWHGMAQNGMARHGMARHGTAPRGPTMPVPVPLSLQSPAGGTHTCCHAACIASYK